MSENTLNKLGRAMEHYARTQAVARQKKKEKDEALALPTIKSVLDAATQANQEEKDARAQVVDVRIPEAIGAGLFEESNRLQVPGIGYVDVTPQPKEVEVSDLTKFLDAIIGEPMLAAMLITDVSLKPGVAQQLLSTRDAFPGLRWKKVPPKIRVSTAQWGKEA